MKKRWILLLPLMVGLLCAPIVTATQQSSFSIVNADQENVERFTELYKEINDFGEIAIDNYTEISDQVYEALNLMEDDFDIWEEYGEDVYYEILDKAIICDTYPIAEHIDALPDPDDIDRTYYEENYDFLYKTIFDEFALLDEFQYEIIGDERFEKAEAISDLLYCYMDIQQLNENGLCIGSDTPGQCVSKYAWAKYYYEGLSSEEREIFINEYPEMYERLLAWARYHGETLDDNGSKFVSAPYLLEIKSKMDYPIWPVIIASCGALLLACFGIIVVKKRKEQK